MKAGLQSELNHDAILASLRDEIDQHNEGDKTESQSVSGGKEREREHSSKFRFKSSTSEPRKRKHRSKDHEGHRHRRHKHKREHPDEKLESSAHPFPREPTNPDLPGHDDPNTAFRDSLFDALADDEGAAYWESVYSQPIHVYPRPTVETDKGERQEMNDDEYAAYVQKKMWEKKNPHIVLERTRKEKERKAEEDARTRRREDFIRRRERAAWERAQKDGARKFAGVDGEEYGERYEYIFDEQGKTSGASERSSTGDSRREYREAWDGYLGAWDQLKLELLNARNDGLAVESGESSDLSKKIPWPVLQGKPVTKAHIEMFMQHIPVSPDRSRLQLLKAERVRWHPDKVQQRFVGAVDPGTMKVVTGIFQIVDSLVEQERK